MYTVLSSLTELYSILFYVSTQSNIHAGQYLFLMSRTPCVIESGAIILLITFSWNICTWSWSFKRYTGFCQLDVSFWFIRKPRVFVKNHLIFISFNSGRFAISNEKQYHSYGLHDYVCRTMLFSWNFRTFGAWPWRPIVIAVLRNHSAWKPLIHSFKSISSNSGHKNSSIMVR